MTKKHSNPLPCLSAALQADCDKWIEGVKAGRWSEPITKKRS